jgi:cytochrome c oxidase subunit 3
VDKEGNRVALADFAATLQEEREYTQEAMEVGLLVKDAAYLFIAEVQAGFEAHPDL